MTGNHRSGRRRNVLLVLETIVFTVLVPGTVTIWLPRDWLKFGASYERYTAAVSRWIPGRAYR